MPIIIKRSSRSSKGGSSDASMLEMVLELIGCIGGVVAMVLAIVLVVVIVFIGIAFFVLFVASAVRRYRLTANARFYQRSIWLGNTRFDTSHLRQLLVLIDRAQATPRLVFEITDTSGKIKRFPLDPSTVKPDQVEKLASAIQAFGSRYYPFPVEIGTI